MTELTINIPDSKVPFCLLPAKELDFTVVNTAKTLVAQRPNIVAIQDADNEVVPAKTYSVEEARKENPKAYFPWTEEEDEQLTKIYCDGIPVKKIAKQLQRGEGAIRSRIKKLELEADFFSRRKNRVRMG